MGRGKPERPFKKRYNIDTLVEQCRFNVMLCCLKQLKNTTILHKLALFIAHAVSGRLTEWRCPKGLAPQSHTAARALPKPKRLGKTVKRETPRCLLVATFGKTLWPALLLIVNAIDNRSYSSMRNMSCASVWRQQRTVRNTTNVVQDVQGKHAIQQSVASKLLHHSAEKCHSDSPQD